MRRALCLWTRRGARRQCGEARQALAAAEKLWGKADRDLPELQQIHKQLAAGR